MTTPIASLYSSHRAPPPPPSPLSQKTEITSPLPTRFLTNRTSVSIKPSDDPFASTYTPPPLGGEERRISEEGSSAFSVISDTLNSANGQSPPISSGDGDKTVKISRRPSFLKTILAARKSRSSTSLSISSPIVGADPPRLGPLRTSASLISLPGRESSLDGRSAGDRTSMMSELNGTGKGGEEVPPTESAKAQALLGVTQKTGHRHSIYTETDRLAGLGQALTTDSTEPTRRITPDNARSSIFTTTSSLPSTSTNTRDTVNSSYAPSSVSVLEEEEEEEEIELYDPLQENISVPSLVHPYKTPSTPMPIPPVPNRPFLHPKRSTISSVQPSPTASSISLSPLPPPAPPSIPPKHPGRYPLPLSRRSSTKPKSHQVIGSTSSLTPPITTPRLSSSHSNSPSTPLTSLYLVCGLPKDSATWSLSDLDNTTSLGENISLGPNHTNGAVQRFWRPEVLGVMTTGDGSGSGNGSGGVGDGVGGLGENLRRGRKGRKMSKRDEEVEDWVRLGKEEVQRIQGKAMKFAFNRDVEIIASTVQPPSTTSSFSFTIPLSTNSSRPTFSGSTASAFDASLLPSSTPTSSNSEKERTYYAVCLTVWSHADTNRSEAIRETLAGGAKAKSKKIYEAVKVAEKGRKLGRKLKRQMEGGGAFGVGAQSDTEGETDGFATDSEWGEHLATSRPLASLPISIPFWLPYAMVLVSTKPVFDLLNDTIRLSWARYHEELQLFSKAMFNVLHFKAPKSGELVHLPVSADETQSNTKFVAKMPGEFDWVTGAAKDHCFPFWPLFRCLDSDNLLKIAEIALSPLGRVLLISNHSVMLGISAFAFQIILEKRGWKGLVHTAVHARDIKIFTEDPGPWLIAIPSQSRSLALSDLPREVAVVDLDTNTVRVDNPHPHACLSGSAREKAIKRLSTAIGKVSAYYSVPTELTEAFPGGRFRPFSLVQVEGVPKDAERLQPAASWDWDEERTLSEFDAILASSPRSTLISKVLRLKTPRKIQELEEGAKHVQKIVRNHAKTFVDRRDLLEGRINRLNTKLGLLMIESQEWQNSLVIFKSFSEKLTKESSELKAQLESEHREARRLHGQVGLERDRQLRLQESLTATETAREQALQQLADVESVRTTLEQQRNLLLQEMRALRDADETSPLYEAVYHRIEALSHRSETSSRPGTSHSGRPNSSRSFHPSPGIEEEDDERTGEILNELDPDGRLEVLKLAVQESIGSIQSRLAIVLRNAELLEMERPRSGSESRASLLSPISAVGSDARSEDTTLVLSPNSASGKQLDDLNLETPPPPFSPTSSLSRDEEDVTDVFVQRQEPKRRFTPKAFQLTPPVSPDNSFNTTPPFVTACSTRRIARRTDSVTSAGSYFDDMDTPTIASQHTSRSQHARQRSQESSRSLARKGSVNSFGVPLSENDSSSQNRYGSTNSRQSNLDDDAQSFVSVSEGFGTASEAGSLEEEERGQTLTLPERDVEVLRSPHYYGHQHSSSTESGRTESPVSGYAHAPVELFTRAAKRRSLDAGVGMGFPLLKGSRLPRPTSSVTITPAPKKKVRG